ncbi:MAG: hypothetical protein EOT05_00815 [Candidatus Microsaccharimonas sossegonensis]|uniref:Uncharacterized protein n=1 Tax=Candidatus Microsaccharimonas sossegonensis TaxID=2506948 RepID=A0A4Q0AGK9_9BACT|nr:MAG: hypothetical protein EOT05_00815 [Candidatus Microsaccharimonas sossegonensis]
MGQQTKRQPESQAIRKLITDFGFAENLRRYNEFLAGADLLRKIDQTIALAQEHYHMGTADDILSTPIGWAANQFTKEYNTDYARDGRHSVGRHETDDRIVARNHVVSSLPEKFGFDTPRKGTIAKRLAQRAIGLIGGIRGLSKSAYGWEGPAKTRETYIQPLQLNNHNNNRNEVATPSGEIDLATAQTPEQDMDALEKMSVWTRPDPSDTPKSIRVRADNFWDKRARLTNNPALAVSNRRARLS